MRDPRYQELEVFKYGISSDSIKQGGMSRRIRRTTIFPV
ncbi:MAG: hypothetical protein IPG32_08610 [Saprospirales bacterium]|nr:hypothetical protein [Saprospirales bacterium]